MDAIGLSETLQSVRFVVAQDGTPTDAILSIEAWRTLLEWLEDLEDVQVCREALTAYKTGETVSWEQVKAELGLSHDVLSD